MKFKPGDMVMVIYMKGTHYPPPFQPGTIATVEGTCPCAIAHCLPFYRIKTAIASCCAYEQILRKIDPEGRQMVEWDWRELLVKTPAQEDQVAP